MEKEIIVTSNSDLRSEWTKLGLNGKVKTIKCISSINDHKLTTVSSTTGASSAISTIMKHAFLSAGKCYFYTTKPSFAVVLKLGVDASYKVSSFEIINEMLWRRRLRMSEVVAALTKHNGSGARFESQYEDGAFKDITGPLIDQHRIDDAYYEFKGLVNQGIGSHSHPAHFNRISRDRGICAVGISECVKRI